jgi:hypothetical protein
MNQEGSPFYTVRGAQPRPVPDQQETRWSRRGSLILVAVMFGWMLVVFAAATIAESHDPNVEVPLDVNLGVIVMPADGWYSAAKVWDVGPTGLSLQSSGAYVAFWAEEYSGTNDDLLSEMVDGLERNFDSFRVLPAAATTIAGNLPGITALFSGVAQYGRVEGEIVVVTYNGMCVVMRAEAQEGQLSKVQDDLDYMLDNLVVPR